MAIAELVSVEQYLHTDFEPDAEFVEGRIVERPMPNWEHSRVQIYLAIALFGMERVAGFFAVTEQRIRTRPDRFRVPDLCVVTERPIWRSIVTTPPHLCVEILSPENRMPDILEKVREYLAFGVEWVWVIDPDTCSGQIHTATGVSSVQNRIFATDRLEIDLANVPF